jgi:NAD(P)H-nitrite reductase large subunit
VRIYIAEGDRTNRTKARLKYVLDRYAVEAGGLNGFLAKVEQQLGRPIARVDAKHIRPRPAQDRQAHIGAHPQKQPGLFYLGVVLPVGKMSCAQIRSLAAIARDLGDGDIRLTVWQNLLISGISEARLKRAKVAVEKAGLEWRASSIRAGLIACAGSRGCRFSAADTKAHAEEIAAWCEARVKLDQPVNIHVAGCHHSCAQHYIGDIGLVAARVNVNEEGDTVDGYHIVAGGGSGATAAIGREILRDVKAEDAPARVEGLLKAYLSHRTAAGESFQDFSARHEVAEGGFAARFAANETFATLFEALAARSPSAEQATYNDLAKGMFRAALIEGGKLDAVLFWGREGDVPPWSGLAEAWRLGRLDGTARRFLLAGRSASADFDANPTICACFGVKSRAILAAIADGACSTDAIGRCLNAGTNCGSCLPEVRRMIAAVHLPTHSQARPGPSS